ncbi:MAG: HEAT repeat domain-containing protein [Isosphaerales bacterium]
MLDWLTRDASEWKTRLKGTALARSKRAGLVRNAALVLGTRRLPEAVAPLAARLDDRHEDATVRAAAAWALGRIGTHEAHAALRDHHDDPEPLVQDAVRRARGDEGQG